MESQNDQIDLNAFEKELKRVTRGIRFRALLRSTMNTLLVVSAAAVLLAVLLMPVMRIYGSSMTPTLEEGEIVISIKTNKVSQGDVVGVYYGSKLLLKRCIARERQWVNIDRETGDVYVDGELLYEPYISEKAFGQCDLELPYQVPDGSIFVMGDHRDTSIDSRNTAVGCISIEDIVGKVIFRVWPLKAFGTINHKEGL